MYIICCDQPLKGNLVTTL